MPKTNQSITTAIEGAGSKVRKKGVQALTIPHPGPAASAGEPSGKARLLSRTGSRLDFKTTRERRNEVSPCPSAART
jgi:hypothetical protein